MEPVNTGELLRDALARIRDWWQSLPRRSQGLLLLPAASVGTYFATRMMLQLAAWSSGRPGITDGADTVIPLIMAGLLTLNVILTYNREFGLFPRCCCGSS